MTATQAHLRGRTFVLLALVCLLCTMPYWRSLSQPLVEDSYQQIWLGRRYGAPDQLLALWNDALYRCRATSIWMTHYTEMLFGATAFVLHIQSLLMHAANAMMIVALGRWERIGYRVSMVAALFWGLAERHHEAVMWYAALPEQLVFFFVLASFFCWLEWWQRGVVWGYAAAFGLYLLALLSKESAVVLCGLCLLPLIYEPGRWRRALIGLSPFYAFAAIYFLANISAKEEHLHWNDGTFTLGWHFALVLMNSISRLFWVWGGAGVVLLLAWRKRFDWNFVVFSILWIVICLMPYSFVAYMPRVPSRHVYLANLGLSFFLSMLLLEILKYRRIAATLVIAFSLWNVGYLWTYKHFQFQQRAEMTQFLKREADRVGRGPIEVFCFPQAPEIAETAIGMHLGLPEGMVIAHQQRNCGPIVVRRVFD